MAHQQMQATAVRHGEGTAYWWLGALAEIKCTAADTGGAVSIVEMTEAPNAVAPLHVHHREDEAFYVLEGSATLYIGDETIEATAGDFAFGPRGVPHRFTVGPDGVRMLFIVTPGGFEDMVREMSEPARERTLPPADVEPPDFERIAAIAAAYGNELLV